MTQYCAQLSPPQLFVGTIFHESKEEEDEEGWPVCIDEYWEQEAMEHSYMKLKKGIESLGLKCLDIEFGDYDSCEGILQIKSISCQYDKTDDMLKTLLTDEAYIQTGISSYSSQSGMVAIYFRS